MITKTKAPVQYVKVFATFYDKNKTVIGTSFTYAGDTSSTPLQPSDTTPFEISSYPDTFIPDSYRLNGKLEVKILMNKALKWLVIAFAVLFVFSVIALPKSPRGKLIVFQTPL